MMTTILFIEQFFSFVNCEVGSSLSNPIGLLVQRVVGWNAEALSTNIMRERRTPRIIDLGYQSSHPYTIELACGAALIRFMLNGSCGAHEYCDEAHHSPVKTGSPPQFRRTGPLCSDKLEGIRAKANKTGCHMGQ
jgi:hypothetical protein